MAADLDATSHKERCQGSQNMTSRSIKFLGLFGRIRRPIITYFIVDCGVYTAVHERVPVLAFVQMYKLERG